MFSFLLKMVKPASDRNTAAKTPSAELSALEKEAANHHIEAMSYFRRAVYDQAGKSALQARDVWMRLRDLGRQGGYGGHLTDRFVTNQIKTLADLYALAQECKELSASVLSHLDAENFLDQDKLREKISCAGERLTYLLGEMETAGMVEKYQGENGGVLWRKRPDH
ncbi:MAG: hypothetical protein ACOYU4_09695 [Thermodesulfobacteriota bacterium]